MTQAGQLFTVTSAAEACRVSRKTITRRLDQLREAGAYKDNTGAWVIPLGALLAVGLSPGRPAAPDAVPMPQALDVGQRIAELEAELAEAQRRADVAEAVARERSEQIGDLRRTIAALEAGRSDRTPPAAPAPEPAATPSPAPRSRGLFERVAGRLGI